MDQVLCHYARFDLLTLGIRGEAWTPTGARQVVEGPSPALQTRLGEVAARYGVEPEQVVQLAEKVLAAERP
ncbi:MAG: hypothetical protein ACE5JN_09560 [Candidatus Methylomirabilia bacterium]